MEYIASFDIGKKNFAFCVEKIDTKKIKQLNRIPQTKRYNKDGSPTPEFDKILSKLYRCGDVQIMAVIDLTDNCDKKSYLDPNTFINMVNELNKYKRYWNKCSVFIIEKQMAFRKIYNMMAIKLAQHCYSYFVMQYLRNPKTIIEYPAYHKTSILGAIKIDVKTKPKRKKWAIQKAISILEYRDDQQVLNMLKSTSKKDDMADCLLMTITYSLLKHYDGKY